MKITILLRYPLVEKAKWKKELINNLIIDNEVNIIFGDSSLFRHFKAGISKFGAKLINTSKDFAKSDLHDKTTIWKSFKSHLKVFKVNDLNSRKTEKRLKRLQPDLIILLGTGIIRKNILSIPNKGVIHIHHGNLPKIRGVGTIGWSILIENELFITAHFVDPGIDTGNIISKRKIEITSNDDLVSLKKKCQLASPEFIHVIVNNIKQNSLSVREQKKNDGKQYYKLHPYFMELANNKIKSNPKLWV